MATINIRPLYIGVSPSNCKNYTILEFLELSLTALMAYTNETAKSPALKEIHDNVSLLRDAVSETIHKLKKSNIATENKVLTKAKQTITTSFERLKRIYQGMGTAGTVSELENEQKKQLNDLKSHINKFLPILENPNPQNLDEIETRLDYIFNIIKNYKQSKFMLPQLVEGSKTSDSIKNLDATLKILNDPKKWAGVRGKHTTVSKIKSRLTSKKIK